MQLVNFTRLRRPSFSESQGGQRPHMTDNLLYDMENTTSSSSSDSDSNSVDRLQPPVAETSKNAAQKFDSDSTTRQNSMPAKASSFFARTRNWHSKSRLESPLKEISMNQRSDAIHSSTQRQLSAGGDTKRGRRHNLSGKKDATLHKRWV